MNNPLIDIFVGHPMYPWHVAPQQRMLPFNQVLKVNKKSVGCYRPMAGQKLIESLNW